MRQSA